MNELLLAALTIAILMVATWLISVAIKDASIVDISWGLGFATVATVLWIADDAKSSLDTLLWLMTLLWGLRLCLYLARRNLGHGEDYRYVAMRKRWGQAFPLISFLTVYTLQGTLMWVVSLPVQLSHRAEGSIGVLAVIGVMLWAVGLYFEVVGDIQLSRFKADSANQGKVLDAGLWRYTRHPNYFGDTCVWWGIAIVACSVSVGVWGLIGAAVMNVLLLKVSGVALLERSLVRRKPEYQAYIDRTSAFIPRPPKS
ncbi:MAG: DUF1295 domain-containing protein [Ilumatobacteraceae bacterium]|nr:DUF1295 domain-containing protein [Ilumatobacteraceae bacterium]